MKATTNTTEWMKIGQIKEFSFIVKDIICYGEGCFLNFINVVTGEETQHTVNFHDVNGDGIRKIRGHRTSYVFVYAENCKNPALYVKKFPSFETVTTFTDGSPEGYSAMEFSETSLLVTLGDLPNFTIIVWNWRKREKIGEHSSNLIMEHQLLRCSWGKPIYMIQMGASSNQLFLWDVFTCCKKAIVAKHEIKLPDKTELLPFCDIVWTTEGGIFIVDSKGSIFSINNVISLDKIIDVEIEGDIRTSLAWYKGGLAVSGPNNEIRHYKKSGDWTCDWTIPLEKGIKFMNCNKGDYLVGVTVDEDLVKISNTQEDIIYLKQHDASFNDFCLIYPTGEYIVALRHSKFLTVYQTDTGKFVSNFELKGKALTIVENPEFPYVAVGYDTGVLELISVYKAEKLSVMASFNLTANPIPNIHFFEQGRVIVTGYLDVGEFFLIEGMPGTQMKIITNINANRQIVDYMLVASKHCYRLFLIPVTSNCLAGNKIIRYCIITRDNINIKEYELENEEVLYYRILPTTSSNRDRLFYLLPFKSRSVHLLETKRGDPLAKLVSEIKTGHVLRKFNLRMTKLHAVTWGYDGFVIARDNNFEKEVGMAVSHHRYLGGVKNAYVDSLGKYIISLGRENNLVCTNIVTNKINEKLKTQLTELKESTKFALMFKRPTIGFKPEKRFQHKTWLEVQKILETEKEEEICREEKQEILHEFEDIKTILRDLLTKNLNGPENEKLDVLEFYLDTALYNQKKQKSKDDCKSTEIYLKALIVAQDAVSAHLKINYWEPMEIKGKIIRGMFSNTMASKYTLLPLDQMKMKKRIWIEEQRKVEQFLSMKDHFEPWMIVSEEQLVEQLQQTAQLETEDYGNLAAMQIVSVTDPLSHVSLETQIALAGTVAQLYIERSLGHYKQNQIVTFYQCDLEQCVTEIDIYKLKTHYNTVFEEMMAQKEREMQTIKEKNARLRHIISELNFFSEKKISIIIIDPEWTQKEKPDMITKVVDYELAITPYISPSEQALLDAKAAEEERNRLALLADDFRERALIAMMNGVLEVRWEDELKKDVPIPKCMLEKEPEQFNEDDLRAVRDYEEKVAFLNSERERYKNLLDVEFTKLATSVRDSIRKFNLKLKDTVEYKMAIDSAMNQENFKINRIRLHENERIKLNETSESIKKAIKETEVAIQKKQKTIASLNEALNDCRINLDVIQAREKILEKAFRKDFQDASPIVQEQAAKLYKKRPKAPFRQINTVTVLYALAQYVGTQEKSDILTNDCYEFLKSLEQLDQYVGVPPTIDENTYNLICKHRRQRIEFEIRLRANQAQVLDGEATISTFQKRVAMGKEQHAKLLAELDSLRADYRYLVHNIQIQLVLRRGLVEVPLTGDVKDFEDAVLVPKKEVEDINKLILEAGQKKLQVIMSNMGFRRNIMVTEWEHKKLRMIINDLIEQLNDIHSVKLTKEMQQYLKAKRLGRKTDLETFEMEVELLAASFENRIRDKREKYANLKKQIHSYKTHNAALDEAISNINIDVCFLQLQKDNDLDAKEDKALKERMDILLRRNCLVQQIQRNHNEILVLQTELELLRLKTYPTFKYKLINTN